MVKHIHRGDPMRGGETKWLDCGGVVHAELPLKSMVENPILTTLVDRGNLHVIEGMKVCITFDTRGYKLLQQQR